jgi:hypothetical protein
MAAAGVSADSRSKPYDRDLTIEHNRKAHYVPAEVLLLLAASLLRLNPPKQEFFFGGRRIGCIRQEDQIMFHIEVLFWAA